MLRLALSFLSILASSNAAFAPSNLKVPKVQSTARAMSSPPLPPPIEIKDIAYGEDSRQYRRTVYTHDDWVKHRDSSRFYRNILSITNSGVYKNLGKEVFATCSIAAGIVVWNCLFGTYEDLAGVVHDGPFKESIIPVLTLPLTPFTLSSPSLGLLLGMSIMCSPQTLLFSNVLISLFLFITFFSLPHQYFLPTMG
jgi:ion channel-forming bestrophin family protein